MKIRPDLLDEILRKNFNLSKRETLKSIMSNSYDSALAGIVRVVEYDDLLCFFVTRAMNNGFDDAKKTPLKGLYDFYKDLYGDKANSAKLKKAYAKLKAQSQKYVGDNLFLFKDVMKAHVECCIKKAEKLKDPGLEMYVKGLESVLDESIDKLKELSAVLDNVLDYSSQKALTRACYVLDCLKEWGNLHIVDCVTSTSPIKEVTAPLKEAFIKAQDWSMWVTGVNTKLNPRCVAEDLELLKWNDDQLKVWTGIE